jgi:5-methylcytosine-specific restriction endonuclease McrA
MSNAEERLARQIKTARDLAEANRYADRVLARAKAHARRKGEREPRSTGPTRLDRKDAERIARAAVREVCVERAGGRCEACGEIHGAALQMDHFWGRARDESIQSCWMVCPKCHFDKTNNRPSRGVWLGGFSLFCERYGYAGELAKCDRAIVLDAAKHPKEARRG